MSINVVEKDLLEASEDYIAHQCNCVTNQSKYIAQQIFDKYPYSNTYKKRTVDKKTHHCPGTIDINGNGKDERYVINMYSQYYPSQSKYSNDSRKLRTEWFKKCLDIIGKELNNRNKDATLAMPYKIGCGSAGGNWEEYVKILTDFVNQYKIRLTLYKYEPV